MQTQWLKYTFFYEMTGVQYNYEIDEKNMIIIIKMNAYKIDVELINEF